MAVLLNGATVAGQERMSNLAYSSASKTGPSASRDPKAVVGTLSGHAAQGLAKPYTDYIVTVRDVDTGSILAKVPMDKEGSFFVDGLAPHRYVVLELRNFRRGGVVWTGGPYAVSADQGMNLVVSVGYGSQTGSWVMTTAADVPTVVPLAIRSGSR